MINYKAQRLLYGETIVSREGGNSMSPRLKSRQPVLLVPVRLSDIVKGDIVFCCVKGKYYTHLVHAIDLHKGCLIGNLRKPSNGWSKSIYGKVVHIFSMGYNDDHYCKHCNLLILDQSDHQGKDCYVSIRDWLLRLGYLYHDEEDTLQQCIQSRFIITSHEDIELLCNIACQRTDWASKERSLYDMIDTMYLQK